MSRSAWAGLILLFILAATLRVGWVTVRHGQSPEMLAYPDEEAYLLAGRSLAAGQGLIDEFGYRATYMPAYPAFIALFERMGLSFMSLRVAQALLAAWVAPATFLLARQWALLVWPPHMCHTESDQLADAQFESSRRVLRIALLAGLAAAFDPFLVFFSGLLLTEALFALTLVATWWLLVRLVDPDRPAGLPASAACGAGVLACVMLRPSATILVPIVPGLMLLYRLGFAKRVPARRRYPHRRDAGATPNPNRRDAGAASNQRGDAGAQTETRQTLLAAAIVMGVVVAGLTPWAARNTDVLGEWRWTTTRGGISLYDGLQFGTGGGSDLAHTKEDPVAAELDELEWDVYWRARAIDLLKQDSGRAMRLGGLKFLRMWNLVPNEPEHRRGLAAVVSAAWMVVVLVTFLAGLWQVRRAVRWWLLLLTPVLAFTLLHMLFVGSVRYRVPLMPMLFVLSAVGVCSLFFAAGPPDPGKKPPMQPPSGTVEEPSS